MPFVPPDANPDNALYAELSDHLDAEASNDLRVETIAQYAAGLLEKGQEDDPWTFAHFEEAMANAPEAARLLTFGYILDSVEHQLCNGKKNYLALTALKYMVDTYWAQIAIKDAEKAHAKKWD
jgi:hypothetical protein